MLGQVSPSRAGAGCINIKQAVKQSCIVVPRVSQTKRSCLLTSKGRQNVLTKYRSN